MVIKITEKCSMHCLHCFNRADENGAHMSLQTLKSVVDKINELPIHLLLVSGGEPTEHPDFMGVMKYLAKHLRRPDRIPVILATNGVYLEDHLEVAQQLHNLFPHFTIQVTNDPRFYPSPIDESKALYHHKYVTVCNEILSIVPQGRAADNCIPSDRVASSCVNFRSFIHQLPEHKIETVISTLESRGKYCTPTIGIDGMFRAGESSLCPPFASAEDSNVTISQKLLAFRCNQCAEAGLNRNIPQVLKDMIGIG